MPRRPLLPTLRLGAVLAIVVILFYNPRRRTRDESSPTGVWATDIDGVPPGALRLGAQATGPQPGQKRPPCSRDLEVEVAGACWIPHAKTPPCPVGSYEGRGRCLVPVAAAPRLPTSIQP